MFQNFKFGALTELDDNQLDITSDYYITEKERINMIKEIDELLKYLKPIVDLLEKYE